VLLLHGYPQTHVMWHRVAPALAERSTVVCADLRGYGDSEKPPGGDQHAYFFLTQPFDLPERLIRSNPEFYLRWTLEEWCGTPGVLADNAVAEYVRCFDAATIHATCEDYRAGATIDLDHDRVDAHEQLQCPLLVLCSAPGLGRQYDVEAVWRRRAPRFRYRALDCGHFIAEERPHETVDELLSLLA
jgi:haloacetate dehalogenase